MSVIIEMVCVNGWWVMAPDTTALVVQPKWKCGHVRSSENTIRQIARREERGYTERCRSCRRAAQARYRHTDKGRAENARYKRTDKGRAANARYNAQYRNTLEYMLGSR